MGLIEYIKNFQKKTVKIFVKKSVDMGLLLEENMGGWKIDQNL